MAELFLDSRIMWWVFLPIIYVTFMLSIVRMLYSKYNMLKTTKKPIKQMGHIAITKIRIPWPSVICWFGKPPSSVTKLSIQGEPLYPRNRPSHKRKITSRNA